MFYCDDCARKRGWPTSGRISYGRCEICRKERECSDVPSSQLPLPPRKSGKVWDRAT